MKWLYFLTKRLLKKPAFLAVLVLLPLLTLLYTNAAQDDSGVVTIALAAEAGADDLACRLLQELPEESKLIRFALCGSVEDAQALVKSGKADGAWLLPADLTRRLSGGGKGAVTVVQREENTALRLSREVLSGVLYRCMAQDTYLDFIRQNAPELAALSDQALLDYYRDISGNETLFQFRTPEGTAADTPDLLLAPLRGLLGILILLAGMAAALWFRQDRRKGVYAMLPLKKLPLVELGNQLAALLCVSAVCGVCLWISGNHTSALREAAVGAVYCLCAAGFSMLLSRLWGSEALLAGSLPVLTVLMLVVCPVFFRLDAGWLPYLLPPTYYIEAAYSNDALGSMVLYTLVCFLGCLPLKNR